ncbi:uncharacterized protein LOC123895758 [Trifolium pratense]|uniref:uncharacterized protein LOC123895758 n=1 Tax=Trifolium pratense TaxID=57577 RepID=UPI001E6911AA|nr:uncharacterized protein LOC123895758 [Trifolium pratense]
MEKFKSATLFLWVFFALCTLNIEARTSSTLEREIEAKLKLLNKPAVKSIKSEDGDIFDCVDIYKQPAFDHPALQNHRIQRIPDFLLESKNSNTVGTFNASSEVFQTWQKSGSCPDGTVPIRRIQKEDLLRAASLDRFGQKPQESSVNSTHTNSDFVHLKDRSDAYLQAYGYNFIGAEANINVWNPRVDKPEDFTTAQLWLKATHGDNLESVEAGWMVNPKLYGDHNTRLFIYWTKDTYKSTGCFDLTCSGFVQTNKAVGLGGALGPISTPLGQQYEINFGIFLDNAGNWWLKLKRAIPVGYWPKEFLGQSFLQHDATIVQWGGQVYSHEVKTKPHTGTQMGSGEASGRFGGACYMSTVRIKDYSQMLKYPQLVYAYSAEPDCYRALKDDGTDPLFYFGGPGRNLPHCP